MKCPYRIHLEIVKAEDGQATFEYFMECDKEECPFYHHIGPEEEPLFETCMKAKKEMERK